MIYSPKNGEKARLYCILSIVFSSLAFVIVKADSDSESIGLLLFCLLIFGGWHRYYAGKIFTGLIFAMTLGFCLIGYIYDLVMITTGSFTDKANLFILTEKKKQYLENEQKIKS